MPKAIAEEYDTAEVVEGVGTEDAAPVVTEELVPELDGPVTMAKMRKLMKLTRLKNVGKSQRYCRRRMPSQTPGEQEQERTDSYVARPFHLLGGIVVSCGGRGNLVLHAARQRRTTAVFPGMPCGAHAGGGHHCIALLCSL